MKSAFLLAAGLGVLASAHGADSIRLGVPYIGTLPCADCAGIRTSIVFSRDARGRLGYRSEETYLGARDGDVRLGAQGGAIELGGTRQSPWAAHVRIDPQFAESRRQFLVLNSSAVELVGANGERAASGLDYKLAVSRFAATPPIERRLFAGTLRRVADRWELVPCGGGAALPALDHSPEASLTAALTDIGLDRVESLYIEAFGRLREGVAWFDRLNRAGTEMRCPGPRAALPQWRATGNEPGWSVSDGNGRMTIERIGQPPLVLPNGGMAWRWRDGRSDLAVAQARGATESAQFSATLTPRLCRDTMADAVYGFRFEGRLGQGRRNTEFKGCAWLGSELPPG